MKYRKLRIAWSVAWGVVAVLLCVLWVRSYWHFDVMTIPNTRPLMVSSGRGAVGVSLPAIRKPIWSWTAISFADVNADLIARGKTPNEPRKFSPFRARVTATALVLSYFYPVIAFGALAALPWVQHLRQFSLRTLLAATTLVAVMLGLIVWLTK